MSAPDGAPIEADAHDASEPPAFRSHRTDECGRRGGPVPAIAAIFVHNVARIRRVIWTSLAAGAGTPALYLFAIGLGLGSQISDGELVSTTRCSSPRCRAEISRPGTRCG